MGFALAMLSIGIIRELVGIGTLFGHQVLGSGYNPALIMILPPGAFILIGYMVGGYKLLNEKFEKRRAEGGKA